MKIHKIVDPGGNYFAFEIENVYIAPKKMAAVLSTIEGVAEVRCRKPFRSPRDVHVNFKYDGKDYMVWEPWGDSSRYWIGPENDDERGDVSPIAAAFERHKPPVLVRWLGDVMTFNLRALWRS